MVFSPRSPARNNYVENLIRPCSQGAGYGSSPTTRSRARANANLCSRVSTARANGLDASVYLTHLLERVPAADTAEALEAPLLP